MNLKILGDCTDDDEAIGVKLLADIKTYLHDQKADRFSSEQLEKYLGELEDSHWPEFRRGRPISKTGISRLLKPFEVRSKTIRLSAGLTAKGYLLEQFKDAFSRYLPKTPPQNVTPVTTLNNKELAEYQSVTEKPLLPFETGVNSFKKNNVTDVTDETPEKGEKEKTNKIPSYKNGWGKVTPIEGGRFWEKNGVTIPIQ